ncbi:MAG TPA: hypothetical protein VJL88_09215 [Nitrospira sp.]|nr:hypothetical protein [Nitrospira sp.]
MKKLLEEASRYTVRTMDALKEATQRMELLQRQEKTKERKTVQSLYRPHCDVGRSSLPHASFERIMLDI